jgi:hypothetical protein
MEIILCLLLFISTIGFSQNHVEFGVSFGANATLSKTIQSSNMTWGYYTPCYPFTWDNHLSIGWGTEKNKIYAVYDGGSLGPNIKYNVYPNKYPLDDDIPASLVQIQICLSCHCCTSIVCIKKTS